MDDGKVFARVETLEVHDIAKKNSMGILFTYRSPINLKTVRISTVHIHPRNSARN